MAGFGDSNDIQISVTLDTKSAVESVEQLKASIQQTLNLTKSEFLRIAEISKQLNQVAIANINAKKDVELQALKNQEAANERSFQTRLVQITAASKASQQETAATLKATLAAYAAETKAARTAATEKIALARIDSSENKKLSGDLVKINQTNTKKILDEFKEAEKTKRQEMKQTLAETVQQTVALRKSGGIASALGSGKDFSALAGGASGLGAALTRAAAPLSALAAGLFLVKEAASVAVRTISGFANTFVGFAEAGNRVQALSVAFSTLQQSVGRDPVRSIERLREATQGLISDTELYQKANQAVLLQVPAKLFEESAEAAVKLGRAMGIDAAFALESLSIGLGRQSRLYLDNLGIVVSATEAYRNFAIENGILGRELTDSEKRLAFFNETSKALKAGLETLPPLGRDAGIAFTELKATTSNAANEFFRAFNSSEELQQALTFLNTKVKELIPAFINAGTAVANFFARLADNSAIQNTISLIGGLIAKADEFFVLSESSKRTRFTEIADDIKAAEAKLAQTPRNFTDVKKFYEEQIRALKAEQTALGVELDIIDTKRQQQKDFKVNLRIDTTDLLNDLSSTETELQQFQTGAEENLGKIRIPGLDAGQVNAASSNLTSIFQQVESGGLTAETAGVKIKEAVSALATQIQVTNIEVAANALKKAQEELSKAPDNEDLQVQVKTLEKRLEIQQKNVVLDQSQRTQLEKLVKASEKAAKAETQRSQRGSRELRNQQKEFESFVKSLRRTLGTAIPDDFQRDLISIFKDASLTAPEFERALAALGKKAQDAGVDMEAFKKEISDLQNLLNKGLKPIDLQVNASTTEAKQKLNEEIEDYNQSLKDLQRQSINIRDILFGEETDEEGRKKGGGFFGFDLGEGIDQESEAAIANSIGDAVRLGLNLAFEEFTREDAPDLGRQVGSVIGAAVGAYFGGAAGAAVGSQIGGEFGAVIGEVIKRNTQDLASTRERKRVDTAFAELFDGERLGIVIEGEIFNETVRRRRSRWGAIGGAIADSIFPGVGRGVAAVIGGTFDDAVNTVGEQARRTIPPTFISIGDLVFDGFTRFAGDVRFGVEEAGRGFNAFSSFFNTLPQNVQAAFNGIGLAFGQLLGVADEQARLLGVVFANNIGGSLQNLQILIQATGKSLEELSEAVINSFLDSKLSIEEAYNALVQLQSLYEVGIPGAVGAYQEAIDNLNNSLQSNAPGRYAIDSLRDIGAEGQEAGRAFQDVISALGQTFTFTADQQVRLFEALRINGITSLQQLQDASNEQLLAILRNIQLIRENATAPLVTTPQITTTPATPRPSGGSRGQSPEDKRREALKKLREETQKLLRDSTEYARILERLTAGELSNAQAGAEIIKLQTEIRRLLERRNDLEKKYEELLAKGRRANKQRLAEIARELDANKKAIDELTDGAKKTSDQFKQINIAAVIPLIKSANSLGVVSRLIGVDLKKTTDILIQGFLRGKLSLEEFNTQLKATQDNLGKGIPNEIGAVTTAFQNLVDAGTRGGQFSVDAFTDIFAEFREKFQKEGSAIREQQRKELIAALESAKAAAAGAVGPEATELAKKSLDAAKKALEDFYETIPAPNLSDLRSQLEDVFGVEEVAKFFQAIDESGLRTFEELENAGVEGILPILARLQELGFKFNETSDEIKGINDGLNDAAREAEGNKDPIQAALDLIKQFNEGASGLPPAFNSTTEAVGGLNDTLGRLRDGFDDIIEKLGLLSGQTYENDVVFNIRTTGDTSSKALVDILFGDGSNASVDTGNGGGGGGGGGGAASTDAAKLTRKRQRLKFLERNGRGSSDEAKRLRKEIRALGG